MSYVAAGVAIAGLGTSIYSSAHAAHKRKLAERSLENMKAPTYRPNQSILDFYQSALQKYNTNPTDSAAYKLADQNIKQGTVQGISALRDRRLGGGINSLVNVQNNNLLKAAVAGENRKAQEFGVLGRAAGAKAGEEGKEFNYNQIQPFQQKYNLFAAKASGQAQVQNASMQNAYNNLGALGSYFGSGKDGNTDWNFGTEKKKTYSDYNTI